MVVYSTRKFLSMLIASALVALLLVSVFIIIIPTYFTEKAAPAFGASPTTSARTITPGSQQGEFSISLKSVNGFSGRVYLTASVTNAPLGIQAAVSPSNLVLSPGGNAAFNLIVGSAPTTPPGNYTVTVLETSGPLSHTDTVTVQVVGFTLTSSSASLSFPSGSAGTSIINIASVNGFSGSISLVSSVSAAGPNASVSPNGFTLNSGETVSSRLVVGSGAPGTFDATVTGISGQSYQSVRLPVIVSQNSTGQKSGDFGISVEPAAITMSPGSSREVFLTLTSMNGCVCLVTLSTSTPPVGFGVGISPFIVGLAANGTAVSTVFINLNQTAWGTYLIEVKGTSLSLTHSATLAITVSSGPVPDFTIEVNPIFFSVVQGSSHSSQITIHSLGGFSGPVTLTTSIIPSIAGGPTATPNPATVNVAPGGDANSTLVVSTTGTTPITPGFNYTVTASSGSLTHMFVGFFTIVPPGSTPDFSLFGFPVTIAAGSSGSSHVSVIASNGFNGTVTLTVSPPQGFTATINQPIIHGSGDVFMAVQVSDTVAPATYSLTLTGTSGALTHQVGVTVVVIASTQPPDFTVHANPTFLNILPGYSGTTTLALTSIFGFSGTVSLTPFPSSNHLSAFFNPLSVTLSSTGSGATANSTLTVTVAADTPFGTYYVNANATGGGRTHLSPIVTVDVGPEFSITTNPSSITIPQGGAGQASVILTSLGTIDSNVSLSGGFLLPLVPCTIPCPPPPAGSFSPQVVKLPAGGNATSTLTITSNSTTTAGTYTFAVTGSNGIFHTVYLNVTVATFSINATQSPSSPTPSTVSVSSAVSGTNSMTSSSLISAPSQASGMFKEPSSTA